VSQGEGDVTVKQNRFILGCCESWDLRDAQYISYSFKFFLFFYHSEL